MVNLFEGVAYYIAKQVIVNISEGGATGCSNTIL